MIRVFILLSLFSFSKFSQAQSKPPSGPPSDKEWKRSRENHKCVHREKLSAQQRISLYPFNKAAKVQLVSFDISDPDYMKLPTKDGQVDYSGLKEIKVLSKEKIDTLTDILYNYGYKGAFTIDWQSQCYMPRNAILFADSSGRAFAYIELCFECKAKRVSAKEVQTGEFCSQKYDLLRAFFARNKITFGTKKVRP